MSKQSPLHSVAGSPWADLLAGWHVLLVEDNEINQQLASHILRRAGASVEIASDGLAAVRCLERNPGRFDAVLMDIKMPGMDGYEATRIIRQQLKLATLPIVAMTAGTRAADQEKAVQAGMDGHVAKPIAPDVLFSTLRRLAPAGKREAFGPAGMPPMPASLSLSPGDLPGIDLRTAMIRLNGDQALWISLMRQFEASQGNTAAEIIGHLAAGQGGEAAAVAHRLRGVAANLGAVGIARLAVEVETAIKDGHRDALPQLLDALQAAMSSVFDLARVLPEPARQPLPPVAKVELTPGLQELKRLLSQNNLRAGSEFDALQPAIEALCDRETARALALAIGSLDFARAERLLANIMAEMAKGS